MDQQEPNGPKLHLGVPRGGAQPTRARLGSWARPGVLWSPRASPLVLPWLPSCVLVPKKSAKSFDAFRLRLIGIFYEVKNKK